MPLYDYSGANAVFSFENRPADFQKVNFEYYDPAQHRYRGVNSQSVSMLCLISFSFDLFGGNTDSRAVFRR